MYETVFTALEQCQKITFFVQSYWTKLPRNLGVLRSAKGQGVAPMSLVSINNNAKIASFKGSYKWKNTEKYVLLIRETTLICI